jgi:hypothetical protein
VYARTRVRVYHFVPACILSLNNNTTPTKVVLSCFGLLGCWVVGWIVATEKSYLVNLILFYEKVEAELCPKGIGLGVNHKSHFKQGCDSHAGQPFRQQQGHGEETGREHQHAAQTHTHGQQHGQAG